MIPTDSPNLYQLVASTPPAMQTQMLDSRDVLARDAVVFVEQKYAEDFVRALETPPAPPEALKRLMRG